MLRKPLVVAALAFAVIAPLAGQVTVDVDPSETRGTIDRTLFSYVNYQALLDQGATVSVLSLEKLNLEGTQQRVATSPPSFEPENDNATPNRFNWDAFNTEGLFPSESLRYVGKGLIDKIREDGMEPVMLLAYNLPWLSPDGDVTTPPQDPEEYAEFAAAALSVVNGRPGSSDYQLNVQYVEIWNEPDTSIYWDGRATRYYELFNTVAERLAEDHPEVKVGGPASLNYSANWTLNFIEECGDNIDVLIYHSYEESPENLTSRIEEMAEYLRDETGNEDAQVMITESDHRNLRGAPKSEYILERQFRLQNVREYIHGFHHFTAKAFNEGDTLLGLVNPNGTLVDYNYWPFWIFRDLVGREVAVDVGGGHASVRSGLYSMASQADDRASAVVYLPSDVASSAVDVTVRMPIPFGLRDGIVRVSRATHEGGDYEHIEVLDGQSEYERTITVEPGSAYAVTVHKDVGDDLVWATLDFEEESTLVGQSLVANVKVQNISSRELSGLFKILGVPQEWTSTVLSGDDRFRDLQPGETATARVRLNTPSVTPVGGSGAYAFVSARPRGARSMRISSTAVPVEVLAPVAIQPEKFRVFTAGGYEANLSVTFENTYSEDVRGNVEIQLPEGVTTREAVDLTVPEGQAETIDFPVRGASDVETGDYTAKIVFRFQGTQFSEDLDLYVRDFATELSSTPVDLSGLRNVDGFTHPGRYESYDQTGFGGRFSLPGHLVPGPGQVRFMGVTFGFPDVEAETANLVEARGQDVPLPAGAYETLNLLTTTVNSSKEESLTVNYADGSRDDKPLQVTDWCVQSRYNDVPVIQAPYRHVTTGVLRDCKPQIFMVRIPLDANKEVESVTLPDRKTLYIVSMTLTR